MKASAISCFGVLGLAVAAAAAQSPSSPSSDRTIRDHLRSALEHLEQTPLRVGNEAVRAARVLPAFYERRLYEPAWSSGSRLSPGAAELVDCVGNVRTEGLDPSDYHHDRLERLLARTRRAPTGAALAEIDLLLTDAFLLLGAHLVSGRVNPETFDAEWIAYRREVDLSAALEEATRKHAPRSVLEGLLPRHRGYRRLRSALARLRDIAAQGGWPGVSLGRTLRPGDVDRRVGELRARLGAGGGTEAGAEVYDATLAQTVRAFQSAHGLAADGVVGERTLAALNVSAEERVVQVELNLERWRWLPQYLGDRYVLVNIPAFSLVVAEGDEEVMTMRTAVGRRYRRTPVFSDKMRYLVLSPSWEVPHRLAVQDKLPEIQSDSGYLARMGFRVFQGWGADQLEVDPTTVDWTALGPQRFPYRLRQEPGPLNALGRIKFMFPNRFNVYLHDTPSREVFSRPERDVSSGCIRLERPLELAELLLSSSPRWNRDELVRAIATGKETVVTLDTPTSVHLLYWTAWADDEGTLHLLRDIYGRDALLAEALARSPASPSRGPGQ